MQLLRVVVDRLREAMAERGLSPYAVARASGVSASTISRLLDGKSKRCRQTTLLTLANALRVEMLWLAGEPVSKQLAFWPRIDRGTATAPDEIVLRQLREVPSDLRVTAARAAIIAMIDLMVDAGHKPNVAAYEAILGLDSLRIATTRLAQRQLQAPGAARAG